MNVTTMKRTRGGVLSSVANQLQRAIEDKAPDPVKRLAVETGKGDSKQPTLSTLYKYNDIIMPPYSVAVLTKLSDLDPYLEGTLDAVSTAVSAGELSLSYEGDSPPAAEQEALEDFFFESNDPTRPESLSEKIKACVYDYLTLGNWNLELVQYEDTFTDLVHAPSEYVRVRDDLEGYVMVKGTERVPFNMYGQEYDREVHQLLRAANRKPGHRIYGKPAIYPLVNTVLMSSLRDEKNMKWFDKGNLADIILALESELSPETREVIAEDYRNTSEDEQSMFILDGVGNAVVEQIKRTLEDSSFTDLETNNRQRILSALRVPPGKIAIYEDANRANSLTQDEVFRNEVIVPMQTMLKVRFDHVIKYGFGYTGWEFTFTPVALKDQDMQSEVHDRYMKNGVYSINDVLRDLGMETVENGDRKLLFPKYANASIIDVETGEAITAMTAEELDAAARTGGNALVERLMQIRSEVQRRTGNHAACS